MHINIQPIEKQSLDPHLLQIHSIFYTIQGEGILVGRPAIFLRLAGCNLQCPSCDTDYTSVRIEMTVHSITDKIKEITDLLSIQPAIVISGGEPFRQNIAPLVRRLVSFGYLVQIETNGSLYVQDLPWDSITIVCSPKTGKIASKLERHIDYFKYVVNYKHINPVDGLPLLALSHSASPQLARPPQGFNPHNIYVQPEDSKDLVINKLNMKACVDVAKKFGYTVSLQTHKILEVE